MAGAGILPAPHIDDSRQQKSRVQPCSCRLIFFNIKTGSRYYLNPATSFSPPLLPRLLEPQFNRGRWIQHSLDFVFDFERPLGVDSIHGRPVA